MKMAWPTGAMGFALTASRARATAATTTVTWETFIPQSRVDAPPAGCDYGDGYEFGGDGHGYDWKASSFRTAAHAVITGHRVCSKRWP